MKIGDRVMYHGHVAEVTGVITRHNGEFVSIRLSDDIEHSMISVAYLNNPENGHDRPLSKPEVDTDANH